ncbi:MAG TPA: hypothetical protein VNA16_03010 [Abditibacteriaceae bacterium]|nr:hypothetical protein [Abditibacteriaceae bacterium]
MHSSTELTSAMFGIESDGRCVASFAELCPGFTAQDRLGVIVHGSLSAISNSALILAAVTAFYDEQRKTGNDFFIYPDYFIFHVGCPPGEYSMFDIWPPHKCVSVEDDPEAILQAVNDRAVSILVLHEDASRQGGPGEFSLQRHTRNAALSRVRCAFLGKRASRAGGADVKITGNAIVEKYVQQVIGQTTNVTETEREAVRRARGHAVLNVATEYYQRVTVPEALARL